MEVITQNAQFFGVDYNSNNQPVVLLLHGLGVDCSSWAPQIPALSDAGYRVITLDIPGFGKSVTRRKRWTISNTAIDIGSLLDALSIQEVILVGISMGGVISLQLALDFPLRIRKLVLINSFSRLRPKSIPNLMYLLKRLVLTSFKGVEDQARLVAKRLFPKPEQDELRQMFIQSVKKSDPMIYRQAMSSLFAYNVQNRLHELKLPVLVISGDNDSTVPLNLQVDLARGISHSKHIVIENAGHAVTIDQPIIVNQSIIDFIGESDPGR